MAYNFNPPCSLNFKDFSPLIITWYNQNKRDLPWRNSQDPYLIWLSEIILQQTRVAQGLPYYVKFVRAYPTLAVLAAAEEEEVLRLWQGLGYYSRARNMLKCARLLTKAYNGAFPASFEELKKLPGVGPYTAAAIASLAFGIAVPSIDGNVYRVLARIFGLEADITGARAFREFYQLAADLMDEAQPGVFNQAVMDFGAGICSPKNPGCAGCIFQNRCVANSQGKQQMLPVKLGKVKKRTRHFNYVVIKAGNQLALRRRPGGDIWQGLYEFHLIEADTLI